MSYIIYNKGALLMVSLLLIMNVSKGQSSLAYIPASPADSFLRIKNLNPYFLLQVDSLMQYQLESNKDHVYWYLRDAPAGVSIGKDNGVITAKVEKSYFLSGKLKYDREYTVGVGMQRLDYPLEKTDTFFTIQFYNTEIIPSTLKPSVNGTLTVDEGETVSFSIQCENGNFPVEHITFFADATLINYTALQDCNQEFTWTPGFDVVKETDSAKVKIVNIGFVGSNRLMQKDTAFVKIIVRDALNFRLALEEYNKQVAAVSNYTNQLKYTFLQLDKNVKQTKNLRTTFDITGSATALTGTVLSSSAKPSAVNTGRVLPGIGISLVPVKEAVAPPKTVDENHASMIRSSVKRLEYMIRDNSLTGERDAQIMVKREKLKEELKQIQVQLIDIPVEVTYSMTPEELNQYFNSRKVNRKYGVKK
jgi:hypothetical protein